MITQLTERIAELTGSGVPFVRATVVRAQDPSSARAGDQAIVLADGSIEGFVGGHCATGSVRTVALDVLQTGTSVLLRVLPDGDASFPESPGASIVVNPCLSGGALEIYLEPLLPPPVLHLAGASPTADAVADFAQRLGFEVARAGDGRSPDGATAVVVSSHGGDEASVIRAALDAGVGFIGLVCSHRRGEAVLSELPLTAEERDRVHVHVGLDIGARTPAEIALSVMAAIVRSVRIDGLHPARPPQPTVRPTQAVDPICGMTVTIAADTPHVRVDGTDHWFCNPGCRERFMKAHAQS